MIPLQRWHLWLLIPVVFVLLWWVVLPNVHLLAASLQGESGWSLEHYSRFWNSPAHRQALVNSVGLSLGSVMLAGVIGIPLAFLFSWYEFPGRRLLSVLASLPVLLPPLVGVIAFLFLYGESGIFTRLIQRAFSLAEPPLTLRGWWALLLVHAYSMYVYFYLLVSAALERLDPALLEAAATLGASRRRVLARIALPLIVPGIVGGALLTFMSSMASFSAPYVFGGGVRVLSMQIYNSKLSGDLPLALVDTVLLALVSLFFLALLQSVESRGRYTGGIKGASAIRRPIQSGLKRLVFGLAGSLAVIALLLPHLTVLLISFVAEGSWTTEILPPRYTFENYVRLWNDPQFFEPIRNSLAMALVATAGNIVFGVAAAYLLVRVRFRGRSIVTALALIPWAIPGTVLAMELATFFSSHQPGRGRLLLVGTFWILPLAYFLRNIPVLVLGVQTSLQQLDVALEEAALSLGATRGYLFRRVILPLALPGIVAGSMLAFTLALGEFVASILLFNLQNRPISIEILSQIRSFNFGGAAAYSVLLIVLIGLTFAVGQRWTGRRTSPQSQIVN